MGKVDHLHFQSLFFWQRSIGEVSALKSMCTGPIGYNGIEKSQKGEHIFSVEVPQVQGMCLVKTDAYAMLSAHTSLDSRYVLYAGKMDVCCLIEFTKLVKSRVDCTLK